MVARLEADAKDGVGDVAVLARALVVDRDDVAAQICQDRRNALELAGLVLELDGERVDAAHLELAALDDARQDRHVDVATRDEAYHVLARDVRDLVEHHGRDGDRTGALGDELLLLDQRQDRSGDLVVRDGHDAVDVLTDIFKGILTRLLDLDAVGHGADLIEANDLVHLERLHHGRCAAGLHAVDADPGVEALERERHAGDQAAAADRHDHDIDVAELLEDLQTDRPLPRDDVLIIEGMDEGIALLLLELARLLVGIVIDARHEADLRAVALGGLDLRDRGAVRQADQRLDAVLGRGERHALGMVTGRARDNALGLLLVAQLRDLVIRAAHLERAGDLEILGLEVNVRVLADLRGMDDVRLPDDALQHIAGMIDLVQRQHIITPYDWLIRRSVRLRAVLRAGVLRGRSGRSCEERSVRPPARAGRCPS